MGMAGFQVTGRIKPLPLQIAGAAAYHAQRERYLSSLFFSSVVFNPLKRRKGIGVSLKYIASLAYKNLVNAQRSRGSEQHGQELDQPLAEEQFTLINRYSPGST
jgi:hypothetical protein